MNQNKQSWSGLKFLNGYSQLRSISRRDNSRETLSLNFTLTFFLFLMQNHNWKMEMFWRREIFWCGILLTIVWFCESESSLSGMIDVDHYLQMESAMISKGRDYLSQERKRLKLLKTYLKTWKKWRKKYANQESEYIAIPQNIFHLFKRLVLDLDQFEETMLTNSYNSTMVPDEFEPPTEDQIKQVVLSLIDLQYLYDLQPQEIMNGTLMGLQLNTSLTMDSCYFIGKTCLEYNDHLCACDWLNLWLSDSPDDSDRRKKVFRSLYPSYIFLNRKEEAYNYSSNYMGEEPYDIPSRDTLLDLGFQLGKLSSYDSDYFETNRLCRGEYDKISHTVKSNLKCRYKYGYSAFLKIAPLKEEDLYDNPKILLYREVIHDSEIERMKAWAAKYLKIATVVGKDGKGGYKAFNYRVSETGFMNNRSPDFTMLSSRIEDMSDLLIDSGEMWQLLGYSPGGHYTMHSDYLPSNSVNLESQGNRVASMLFYFNDVILGGETVFTRIRLSVKPIKGAAIIWYNVHSDGSQNFLVDHCACPVLIGEKWGFTQWFRSRNQISLRRIFEDDDSITPSESSKIPTQVYKKSKRKHENEKPTDHDETL